ncbi:Hypp5659 [Branchiostoma lanceolatum]|uniref:Hypp5659 protein n=1 Tax=Branchiostoma lanceolatum TaxID=7740 RepID=A0A8J9YRH3_BRALA|nr:Hypp5659 [Branchiostoma lanceolatum]
MKFAKPSMILVLTVVVLLLGISEANGNSTPELEPVRLCGRDFIRTVVRVCPGEGRRRRSLEEFEIPSKTSSEEGKTREHTIGLADVLGLQKWREGHRLTKRNVRLAERCCHQGCTIAEIAESVCF